MNEEKLPIEEVLNRVVSDLNDINVPVGLLGQIGVPIHGCITNLTECIRAINEFKKPKDNEVIDLGEIDLSDVEEEK